MQGYKQSAIQIMIILQEKKLSKMREKNGKDIKINLIYVIN